MSSSHSILTPTPQPVVFTSSIAAVAHYIGSILTYPLSKMLYIGCKVGLHVHPGFRGQSDNRWVELFYRVLYVVQVLCLMPFVFMFAPLGACLRFISGFWRPPMVFVARTNKIPSEPPSALTICSFNTAMLAEFIVAYNGIRPPHVRLPALIAAIRQNNDDIVCLQEIFHLEILRQLSSAIADLYPFSVETVGYRPWGLSSGCAIYSKFPLRAPFYYPHHFVAGTDRFANKGMLAVTVCLSRTVHAYLFDVHLNADGDRRYDPPECRRRQLAAVQDNIHRYIHTQNPSLVPHTYAHKLEHTHPDWRTHNTHTRIRARAWSRDSENEGDTEEKERDRDRDKESKTTATAQTQTQTQAETRAETDTQTQTQPATDGLRRRHSHPRIHIVPLSAQQLHSPLPSKTPLPTPTPTTHAHAQTNTNSNTRISPHTPASGHSVSSLSSLSSVSPSPSPLTESPSLSLSPDAQPLTPDTQTQTQTPTAIQTAMATCAGVFVCGDFNIGPYTNAGKRDPEWTEHTDFFETRYRNFISDVPGKRASDLPPTGERQGGTFFMLNMRGVGWDMSSVHKWKTAHKRMDLIMVSREYPFAGPPSDEQNNEVDLRRDRMHGSSDHLAARSRFPLRFDRDTYSDRVDRN